MGAVVGLVFRARLMSPSGVSRLSGAATVDPGGVNAASIEESIAWQYARAYQEGDWAKVTALTLWAQERLQLIQESGSPADVEREKDALMASFGTRTIADNRLLDTGVDDQYVFTPGAALTFERVDEGRDDLEKPVARRTWLTATYPAREKALLDRENVPIHSVRVGINVSHDGFVLKANVVGNLDIDWTSISYGWPST